MAIPSLINSQLILSKIGTELNPTTIIAKNNLWILFLKTGKIYIRDYNNPKSTHIITQNVSKFYVTNSIDGLGSVVTDKILLWTIENNILYATEIEPFLTATPPVIGAKVQIKTNVSDAKIHIDSDAFIYLVTVYSDSDFGSRVELNKYSSVGGTSLLSRDLQWDSLRKNTGFSIYKSELDLNLILAYIKTGSPENLYEEEYSLATEYIIPNGDVSGVGSVYSNTEVDGAFTIALNPEVGFIGNVITITSTQSFDPIPSNNKIYFGNILASQFQLINTNTIEVIVPVGASTDYVHVEKQSSISNYVLFEVIYNDVIFDSKDKVKGRFDFGSSKDAIYSKDICFNNFTQTVDENNLVQNVYNIILTKKGERLFNPNFGCEIHDKLFSLLGSVELDESELLEILKNDIELNESRVTVLTDKSEVFIQEEINTMHIKLTIQLPSGSIRVVSSTLGSVRVLNN